MEHKAVFVKHVLDAASEPYEAICKCGHYTTGASESHALTLLDDHIFVEKNREDNSVRR
jgi:hypothetical protein